jgi:glycogen operon protein
MVAAAGSQALLGAHLGAGGAAFAVYSANATRIDLCLETPEGFRQIPLSRQGDVFSAFVPGVAAGQRYGFRAEGPYDPAQGHLFDPAKLLVDPYAQVVSGVFQWHPGLAQRGFDSAGHVPLSIVSPALPPQPRRLATPVSVIYEIGVRAFTMRNAKVPPEKRGTVAALAEPAVIDHLLALGVDTVELMPLMAWADERHLAALQLRNAWGYNPYQFFAPDPRLAPGGMAEVRQAIAALHAAGLNVVLDVVYNHTGESDLGGPMLSLRGLDGASYYRMANGQLANDTGCGNTLCTDHPATMGLILDSMRHWAEVAGVDGFRYDLATVLGRRQSGFDGQAPLLRAIQADPVLGSLIHIAEPWDIGPGGYQLGHFPPGWAEWNDRYRDDVRHFWRGDAGTLGAFATRLAGSSDVFNRNGRAPSASVAFVAAHDGFTLRDVVSHNAKNNFANGENNRDGNGQEPCWIAADPVQDDRALLGSLFASRGRLMLTAGDEFGRTQGGNNNAYAQDNETSWLDWSTADTGLMADVAALIRFRRQHQDYFTDRFLTGSPLDDRPVPDVAWLGPDGKELDWARQPANGFAMVLASAEREARLAVMFNRSLDAQTFTLPEAQPGYRWSSQEWPVPPRAVAFAVEEADSASRSRQPDDGQVIALAEAAGLQRDWWEVNGTHHLVSLDTMRALLKAMDVPAESAGEAREQLRRLRQAERYPTFLPLAPGAGRVIATPAREGTWFELSGPGPSAPTPLRVVGGALQVPPLAEGRHVLRPSSGEAPAITLLVDSGRCFDPPLLATGKRVFGLTSHLYALRDPDDCGIGDFETLAQFGETSARMGGSLVGINPLHCMFTDDRSRVSPYQPSDRRMLDPVYIDLRAVRQRFGMAEPNAAQRKAMAALRERSHVDYQAVWNLKDAVLHEIFTRTAGDADFQRFIADGGPALAAYARYEAHGRKRGAAYAMWLQWIADLQFAAAATRVERAGLGLGIYRDLALGCAFDGGEVASNPQHFVSQVSIGSPPDPFSASGQVWNLPPFNPLVLAATGFAPFSEVLRANMRHAGMLRIDHVLGLARQFWVPRGASGAEGAYVRMPQEALMAVVAEESKRASCTIVGEDLGTVAVGFRQALDVAHMMSYRVLWFEQDAHAFVPPAAYPPWAVACLSSHDLLPFKAWVQSAPAEERAKLDRAIEEAGVGSGGLLADAHALLSNSRSAVLALQADDLSGETEPLNVPGTDSERPNWRRRLSLPVGALPTHGDAQRVVTAIHQTGRGL